MTDFDTLFSGRRVMAILGGYSAARSAELAERAWDLGIAAVEVPAQTPDALRALEAVASTARDRGTSERELPMLSSLMSGDATDAEGTSA